MSEKFVSNTGTLDDGSVYRMVDGDFVEVSDKYWDANELCDKLRQVVREEVERVLHKQWIFFFGMILVGSIQLGLLIAVGVRMGWFK